MRATDEGVRRPLLCSANSRVSSAISRRQHSNDSWSWAAISNAADAGCCRLPISWRPTSSSHWSMPPPILQLLSKLSVHAGEGAPRTRLRAEQALRERIRSLIEHWDATPAAGTPEYERVLESLPGAERDLDPVLVYAPEPQRIILTS